MRAEHGIEVRAARWPDDAALLGAVRRTVFVVEQHVPEALEWDGLDAAASHWLAVADGTAVGTVRLLADGHIGRMAVLAPWRGRGLGSRLLVAAIAGAAAQGLEEVFLHAQTHALGFYRRHGFVAEGEEFMDAGIPHYAMRRRTRP